MPLPVMNSMPSAITGPGAPSDPSLATSLTVVNSRAVSNCQISWPSAVESDSATAW